MSTGRYPIFARLRTSEKGPPDTESSYEFGLTCILDGIASHVAARHTCSKSQQHRLPAQAVPACIASVLPASRTEVACTCKDTLATAIITDRATISPELRDRFALLLGRYLD